MMNKYKIEDVPEYYGYDVTTHALDIATEYKNKYDINISDFRDMSIIGLSSIIKDLQNEIKILKQRSDK